jgi:aspartyl-tRNA(Asn)/glutamyl-tRNA(Gln) amidotransferase subunit C
MKPRKSPPKSLEQVMSKLSLKEVEHIADLARLGLSNAEKETFRDQLSSILEYAERLNHLDTSDVPPTTSAIPLNNVMRPDEVTPSLPTDETLANAPDSEAGQFRVRAILE